MLAISKSTEDIIKSQTPISLLAPIKTIEPSALIIKKMNISVCKNAATGWFTRLVNIAIIDV